ncbi:outer membrane protein assembly factor BamD [uncultured Winogradskyella sp.]|uniref:outer membrane protein assembly factor BamD n=1 Tax=uncultured Winogradskyella sp. TaxID=395353 RepID=UPI0026098380|nr:outer membrane protein assembly factor BamD [uncultured Winogradskyella sp.]
MKRGLYILFITTVLVSCSDFQKALRSEDVGEKFKLGTELFEAGKYNKAFRLFEQVLPKYRGKPQAEKLTFMHAMCSYQLKDYYISSYHFDKFTDVYPKSEKAEQAAFLSAKGYYYNSPVYSKEQKETVEAIEKFQLFINQYPNSQYGEEANKLVKELDYKLEKKAFEIAKQYDLIRDYKASVKSFNNFLFDFPGSRLKEEALYYRLHAEYNLALLSIESLKAERLQLAINYYKAFKKAYPNSQFQEETLEWQQKLNEELQKINTKDNTK